MEKYYLLEFSYDYRGIDTMYNPGEHIALFPQNSKSAVQHLLQGVCKVLLVEHCHQMGLKCVARSCHFQVKSSTSSLSLRITSSLILLYVNM